MHGKRYSRSAYTIASLFSDVGGQVGSVFGIIASIVMPYSYFSFVLHSAGQLFFAKLKENELFKKDNDFKTEAFLDSTLFSKEEKDEIYLHRPILLNTKHTFMLYFSWLKCCCSSHSRGKTELMEELYSNV